MPKGVMNGGVDPSEIGKIGAKRSAEVRRKNRDVAKIMDRHLQAELSEAQLRAYKSLGYKVPENGIVTKLDFIAARNIEKAISTGSSKDLVATAMIARYIDIEGVPIVPPDDSQPIDGQEGENEIDDTLPTIINVSLLTEVPEAEE